MGLVEAGKITLKEGAEKIGMSYRQTKRIRKRVKKPAFLVGGGSSALLFDGGDG